MNKKDELNNKLLIMLQYLIDELEINEDYETLKDLLISSDLKIDDLLNNYMITNDFRNKYVTYWNFK